MVRNSHGYEPLALFHLKLAARIALNVGTVACVGLLLMLVLTAYEEGTRHEHNIVAYGLTSQDPRFALLVFGLAIVAFSGVTTWLIFLYGSSRIASPLYQLSHYLEIERGPVAPEPICKTDDPQREWREFDASAAALHGRYDDLGQAVGEAGFCRTGAPDPLMLLRNVFARLRKIDFSAQL